MWNVSKIHIFSTKSREKGKTLPEMLAVLAIMGVLSVVGLASYYYASQKRLVNDLIYTVNMINTSILGDIENRSFSDIAEMNNFLSGYTRIVEKYKISFFAIESSFPEKDFGTNIEILDGSNMPPKVCRELILGMQKQHPIQAIDVKKGQKQTHIEIGTIDIDTICGK